MGEQAQQIWPRAPNNKSEHQRGGIKNIAPFCSSAAEMLGQSRSRPVAGFHRNVSMNKNRASKQNSNHKSVSSGATVAVIGACAGLVGGLAMAQFTRLWNHLATTPSEPLSYSPQEWDATSKIAKACAKRIPRRSLTSNELKGAAAAVHYAIASSTGVLYAMMIRTELPKSRWSGAIFGAGMWLVGNKVLLPALGIIKRDDYDLTQQANALGEHLAYGLTTDLICRRLLQSPADTE